MFLRTLLFAISSVFCLSAENSLSSRIPPFIWQTYKTTTLPTLAFDARESWIRLNPEFSCFLWDDLDIERYIQENWPSDFLDFFHALPIGAMKADLWRYLIIASEGGLYSDVDSVCILPIRQWPIKESTSQHLLLLDLDCNQRYFCQWTFAATPKHPFMHYLCYYVLKEWKQRKGLVFNSNGTIAVLETTGPIIFSEAMNSYLGEPLKVHASTILKKYTQDKTYRERLNRLGIFLTRKGFFSGQASKNLFWGTWHNSLELK